MDFLSYLFKNEYLLGQWCLKVPLIVFIVFFFSATTTKHVSIQSPSNDISPMSVISGVKSSPRKEKSSLSKKGEKLPRFGVKTEQEPELSTVRKACCCTPVLDKLLSVKNVEGVHCTEINLASTFRGRGSG